MSIVYLNGSYVAADKASISVLDRGFLFADSIYDVIPIFHGSPLRAEQHLARLNENLEKIHLKSPHTITEWQHIVNQVTERYDNKTLMIYIQVSRGPKAVRNHNIPESYEPTVLVAPFDMPPRHESIDAVTMEDLRWKACHIKANTLLSNVMAKEYAKQQGVTDTIFVCDGNAIEGTSSNLFIAKDNTLFTPPLSANILPGVTRSLVIEIANNHEIALKEENISLAALEGADEIFLTSSTQDVLPVTRLNNQNVGTGKPGAMGIKLNALFEQLKQDEAQHERSGRSKRPNISLPISD
jgi:D-alanine transaminase